MIALNESNSMISNTRQPFARRHNQSCVYYGIRGNTRSQYLWDKSCVLDGALGDAVSVVEEHLNKIRSLRGETLILVSRTSTRAEGVADGVPFMMMERDQFQELNNAIVAVTPGGALTAQPDGGAAALLVPDAQFSVGLAAEITPRLQAAVDILRKSAGLPASPTATSGMSTKAKVLIGLGLAVAVGGVALISLSRSHTNQDLYGAPRRRRRRR